MEGQNRNHNMAIFCMLLAKAGDITIDHKFMELGTATQKKDVANIKKMSRRTDHIIILRRAFLKKNLIMLQKRVNTWARGQSPIGDVIAQPPNMVYNPPPLRHHIKLPRDMLNISLVTVTPGFILRVLHEYQTRRYKIVCNHNMLAPLLHSPTIGCWVPFGHI